MTAQALTVMTITSTTQLLRIVETVAAATSPDLTARQLGVFLIVAAAGRDGIDATTIQARSGSSQAATSRSLRKLSIDLKLIKAVLDPADGRRRIFLLEPAGHALLTRLHRLLLF
jgi:DNA-binding MarR family transcriptional regulator